MNWERSNTFPFKTVWACESSFSLHTKAYLQLHTVVSSAKVAAIRRQTNDQPFLTVHIVIASRQLRSQRCRFDKTDCNHHRQSFKQILMQKCAKRSELTFHATPLFQLSKWKKRKEKMSKPRFSTRIFLWIRGVRKKRMLPFDSATPITSRADHF